MPIQFRRGQLATIAGRGSSGRAWRLAEGLELLAL